MAVKPACCSLDYELRRAAVMAPMNNGSMNLTPKQGRI
jgi:hypothetical protein